MSDRPVTLDLLAEQMRRLQADVRLLRDDMDVVAAMVRRLDHSIARLETNQALVLDELRQCTDSSSGPPLASVPSRSKTVAKMRAGSDRTERFSRVQPD